MTEGVACRVCRGDIIVWPADAVDQAICPMCCADATHHDGESGHRFVYGRFEGRHCGYCGCPPDEDFIRWLEDHHE